MHDWVFDDFCSFANETQYKQYLALRRHCNSAEASARTGANAGRAWMPSGVGKQLIQAIQSFGFPAILDILVEMRKSSESEWGSQIIHIFCKAPSLQLDQSVSTRLYIACDSQTIIMKQYGLGVHMLDWHTVDL